MNQCKNVLNIKQCVWYSMSIRKHCMSIRENK